MQFPKRGGDSQNNIGNMGGNNTRCFAQRYELDIQIDDYLGAKVWRAYDSKLEIPVTVLLLPDDDSRSEHLINSCLEAAELVSPNVVAINNVIQHNFVAGFDDGSQDHSFVGIVSEEVSGQNLTELLARTRDEFSLIETLNYANELAHVLQSTHSQGVTHGHLRTSDVLITDSHTLRLAGFGICESLVLENRDADVFDDIRDFGLVTFELLTCVKPFADCDVRCLEEDLRPSMVRRDIQIDIDEFFACTQNGTYASMSQVVEDLDSLVARYKGFKVIEPQHIIIQNANLVGAFLTKTKLRAVTACLLILLGFGALSLIMLTASFGNRAVPSAMLPSDFAGPTPSFTNSGFPVAASKYFYPSTISDYDPLGDGQENPNLARLAIDGNLKSTWRTEHYKEINLAGKAGVGLLVDLGKTLKPNALFIHFYTPGHNAKLFLSNSANVEVAGVKPYGQVFKSAKLKIFMNVNAQSGRYLLIWLTRLPKGTDGNFVGGVNEIQVRL